MRKPRWAMDDDERDADDERGDWERKDRVENPGDYEGFAPYGLVKKGDVDG